MGLWSDPNNLLNKQAEIDVDPHDRRLGPFNGDVGKISRVDTSGKNWRITVKFETGESVTCSPGELAVYT